SHGAPFPPSLPFRPDLARPKHRSEPFAMASQQSIMNEVILGFRKAYKRLEDGKSLSTSWLVLQTSWTRHLFRGRSCRDHTLHHRSHRWWPGASRLVYSAHPCSSHLHMESNSYF